MPDNPSDWITDDGSDDAWSRMPASQRAALPAEDPRSGPDGAGRSFRAFGVLGEPS